MYPPQCAICKTDVVKNINIENSDKLKFQKESH